MALRYLVTIITLVSVAATDPIPLSSFHFAQTQYVAADPGMLSTSMNSGTGASMWGVWQQDPGPRGVRLNPQAVDKLMASKQAPYGWAFDSNEWWLEETGLLMEKPVFPIPDGRYALTWFNRAPSYDATVILTIDGDTWKLDKEHTLDDVIYLPYRSAVYTGCSPKAVDLSYFPVAAGAAMPEVAGCTKTDFSVLFIAGIDQAEDYPVFTTEKPPQEEPFSPQSSAELQLALTTCSDDTTPSPEVIIKGDVQTSVLTMNTGAPIPRVALGVYQSEPGAETYEAVRAALKAGYRHIDTAALYKNEESVGKAVRDSGIPRKDIFITTKLWSLSLPKSPTVDAYKFVMSEAQKSLQRLGTYADLYLIHSPHNPQHRLTMWRAMSDLVTQGKVQAVGVSNYGVHHIEEIIKAGLRVPAVNQIELHPFLRQDKIASYCKKHDILVEAYSPLAKAVKFGHRVLKWVAAKHSRSEAQIMIRWSLQKGYVTLPKSVDSERIRSNAKVFDFALDNRDMQQLDGLDEHFVTGWDPTILS